MAPKKILISPTKSNHSQQDIANDPFLLQIQNQELAKDIKDLYQRTNQLLNSMEILKSENSTLRQELALNPQLLQIQGRVLQTNQQVQEIQNFGILKKYAPKCQMIQWKYDNNLQHQKIPRRIMICWNFKRLGNKIRNCFQFQQEQNKIIGSQQENIFRVYCNQEGKIYRKKYSNSTKKFQTISMQQMNSIRNNYKQTFRKPIEKTNENYENL